MISLMNGDCLELMKYIPDGSVDAVICDPPYGLGKEPDPFKMLQAWITDDHYEHKAKRGFMGKEWDSFVPQPAVWKECLRVLKPGGHLISFFGTRTYDIGTLAVRLAGFEIRDQIGWLYGSGFPKSLNISKAIDKLHGAEREVVGIKINADGSKSRFTNNGDDISGMKDGGNLETLPSTDKAKQYDGWGTALKPAFEPIVMARKPLSEKTVAKNVLKWGTGGINIDDCRVSGEGYSKGGKNKSVAFGSDLEKQERCDGSKGRFPANIIHDGSDEVESVFPDSKGQQGALKNHSKTRQSPNGVFGTLPPAKDCEPRNDSSTSASRFFYCTKTSKKDRNEGLEDFKITSSVEMVNRKEGSAGKDNPRAGAGRSSGNQNNHPTVKPTELMKYLCKLVTPKNGTILDPFMGSGSTGKAAVQEGFNFIGIELDKDYFKIAESRIDEILK